MKWFEGIATFVMLWWLVLFVLLPVGLAPRKEDAGGAAGAPAGPQLRLKAAVATPVAAIIWGVFYFLLRSGVIRFH